MNSSRLLMKLTPIRNFEWMQVLFKNTTTHSGDSAGNKINSLEKKTWTHEELNNTIHYLQWQLCWLVTRCMWSCGLYLRDLWNSLHDTWFNISNRPSWNRYDITSSQTRQKVQIIHKFWMKIRWWDLLHVGKCWHARYATLGAEPYQETPTITQHPRLIAKEGES